MSLTVDEVHELIAGRDLTEVIGCLQACIASPHREQMLDRVLQETIAMGFSHEEAVVVLRAYLELAAKPRVLQ